MLRQFLWTAGIAAVVFGLGLGLTFAFPALQDAESGFGYYVGGVVYYTTCYLAPLAFLVGAIGSLVCFLRSRLRKKNS
jgi:hypothetical protein